MAYSGKKRSDCFGDEEVRENPKVPRMWIVDDEQDGDCITSVNHKALNVEHWVRAQHKAEAAAAPSIPPGSFQQRAIASAMALQDIPNIDPTRPPVFQTQAHPPPQGIMFQAQGQAQPQSQSQSQSQSAPQTQAAKLSAQQQQKLHLQLLQHQMQQQLQQQQQHQHQFQLQHKQLQQNQQKQLQNQQHAKQEQMQQHQLKQEQIQQQQAKLEMLQQLLQQEQIQQDQLRWIQQQNDIFGPIGCSPAPAVVLNNLKTGQQLYGDWDLQAALSAGPVQNSCVSRPQSSGSLISDAGNDQVSSILSSYHSEAQQPPGSSSAAGTLGQELQTDASWIPSSSKDSPSDPQLLAPYSLNGRYDAAPLQGCLFSSNLSEQGDQMGLPSLSAQQLALLHRSPYMKEQEQVHPELMLPNRHLPAGAMIPSMGVDAKGTGSRALNQFAVQNQTVYGKQPLVGNYSVTATDLPVHQGATVGGNCESEAGVQHQTPVAQPRRPMTRTYTKVIKLGSIGRAVDVNRFKNYTELRCELARMFGLEGQLDRESGWQLVFVDNENDLLLVGDDPWEEFVTSVRGIRILSPAEVTYFMNSDDKAAPPFNCLGSSVMTRI